MAELPLHASFPPGMDRLELLQTFVRIVEAGSLSAAAAQLGITQPTISRRLQALERSLGLLLLQRTTHLMRLTLDGERCYEQARTLLERWAVFESELRGAQEVPEGILRVVVPHAFGQELLVKPLAAYLERHPQVAVEWLLHDDQAVQDYIAAGIDCAIQLGKVADSSLVCLPLSQVPRIFFAAPSLVADGLPDSPEALARLPWLALRTFYRNEVSLTHRTTGEVRKLSLRPRFSTDSLYALRSAALRGLGVGLGSLWAVQDDLLAGRLVQLAPEWQAPTLPVNLIYPYASFYPARLRAFINIMRDAMPAVMLEAEAGTPPRPG